MSRPFVMDIKLGRVTWPPGATKEQIARHSIRQMGTKIPYGFSLQGMVLPTNEGVKRLTKKDLDSLNAVSIHTILENFLGERNNETVFVAKSFQKKLNDLETFFGSQTLFHNFGSSLLCVYDQELPHSVKVHVIDYVYALPGNGKIDNNLLFGLKNVRVLFDEYISDIQH